MTEIKHLYPCFNFVPNSTCFPYKSLNGNCLIKFVYIIEIYRMAMQMYVCIPHLLVRDLYPHPFSADQNKCCPVVNCLVPSIITTIWTHRVKLTCFQVVVIKCHLTTLSLAHTPNILWILQPCQIHSCLGFGLSTMSPSPGCPAVQLGVRPESLA